MRSLATLFLRGVGFSLVLLVLGAACAPGGTPEAGPTPAPSPTPRERAALCQPFPDRLIDDFLAAYEARDEVALAELVQVGEVRDLSAVAFAGRAEFASVEEWARAAWEADDEIRLTGYGAFAGSRDGFTMYSLRRNDALEEAGIPEALFLLHARSTGCVIDELGSVGPVQARGDPCRFYEAYGHHPAVAAEIPAPCADGTGALSRLGHDAVWTGREMVVVGGSRGMDFYPPDLPEGGLRYRPDAGRWEPTSEAPPRARSLSMAVWTGTEVVVWGSSYEKGTATASAYDPAADGWRLLPPWPLEDGDVPAGVWTGSELILWGSSQHTDRPTRHGAVYDPAIDGWRRTAPAPIAGRQGHTAVWTGREVIVWGGSNFRTDLGDGAAYDPATDTWREIAAAPLRPRTDHVAVWTGREMLVWGGSSYSSSRANGAAYDPGTDTWRRLPPAPIGGRHRTEAVWTGELLLIWGGYNYRDPLGDGAAYHPGHDQWSILPDAPISPRCNHSAVWAGRAVVVFGGYDACGSGGHIPFGDGAAYEPKTGAWTRFEP